MEKSYHTSPPGGKDFVIEATDASKENIYVQEVYLNEEPLNRMWLWHSEIINGGALTFIWE